VFQHTRVRIPPTKGKGFFTIAEDDIPLLSEPERWASSHDFQLLSRAVQGVGLSIRNMERPEAFLWFSCSSSGGRLPAMPSLPARNSFRIKRMAGHIQYRVSRSCSHCRRCSRWAR
jgi:hypothetical protein